MIIHGKDFSKYFDIKESDCHPNNEKIKWLKKKSSLVFNVFFATLALGAVYVVVSSLSYNIDDKSLGMLYGFLAGFLILMSIIFVGVLLDRVECFKESLLALSGDKCGIVARACERLKSADDYRLRVVQSGRRLKNFDLMAINEIQALEIKAANSMVCKRAHGFNELVGVE